MTTRTLTAVVAVLAAGCGREPVLNLVSPAVARSGEEVLVLGSGLGSRAGAVTFDGATAQLAGWSEDALRVVVPRQTHPDVELRVTTHEGVTVTLPFTIYDAMIGPDGLAGAATTFVSISFDDTTADQLAARPALAETGIRATFYVNSARIDGVSADLPAYLKLEDLLALKADGHEFGGHTKHHLDLTFLGEDEQLRQVCGDRERLLALGLDAQTFAYPFGAHDAALERIVQLCGYSGARLMSPRGSPWPLVAPPPSRFAIPPADPIVATTTLAQMQALVTDGEKVGSGWVPLVFHRVCDDGCSGSAVKPGQFAEFLRWLAQREAQGTVTRTVRQMVGAGAQLARSAPVAPGRGADNLIANPSLEVFSNGTMNPDCWLVADTGHELANWSKVSPGHDGDWALRLNAGEPVVSSRRIKMMQDDGACAPAVTVGAHYAFSVWYQSDVPLRFNSFLRDEREFWAPWGLSPLIPASPGVWAHASWTMSAIPTFGRALAVSVRLQSTDGTMTVDDFALTRINP